MLKILHLAAENFAGVPYSFYQMHKNSGDFSRLVTFYRNPLNFKEDVCLNYKVPNFNCAKFWRMKKIKDRELQFLVEAPVFKPKNFLESFYFNFSDFLRKGKVNRAIEDFSLNDFDIIHYDGGLDFFRNSKQALKWKKDGKKIVCCYLGSDLRSRGIIKEMDEISDLNITSEYDHLKLKGNLEYIFYPYDCSELPEREIIDDGYIKIVHSPTNRIFKGTSLIINVIEKLKKEKKIKFILLEHTTRDSVLQQKSKCDIVIDQVGGSMGGTGYGKAGIEALGMGVPVITNMTNEYSNWLPENPFVVANDEDELYNKLNLLIEDLDFRTKTGQNGKEWVQKYHGYKAVDSRLKELYVKHNII